VGAGISEVQHKYEMMLAEDLTSLTLAVELWMSNMQLRMMLLSTVHAVHGK
jgi:hypothetical protein